VPLAVELARKARAVVDHTQSTNEHRPGGQPESEMFEPPGQEPPLGVEVASSSARRYAALASASRPRRRTARRGASGSRGCRPGRGGPAERVNSIRILPGRGRDQTPGVGVAATSSSPRPGCRAAQSNVYATSSGTWCRLAHRGLLPLPRCPFVTVRALIREAGPAVAGRPGPQSAASSRTPVHGAAALCRTLGSSSADVRLLRP
jgi:hypothetical protein